MGGSLLGPTFVEGGIVLTRQREAAAGSGLTTVPSAGVTAFPLDISYGPDNLLDLSNPVIPTIRESGIYAVTADFLHNGPDTPTLLGSLYLEVNDQEVEVDSTMAMLAFSQSCLSLTWYMAAGSQILLGSDGHTDTGNDHTFRVINFQIQKIGMA